MNRVKAIKPGWRAGIGLAMGVLVYVATVGCSTESNTSAPVVTAKNSEKRMLSGAELYSMNCNRCHPERYPTERTAAQWRTILLHMRVRANLPADQARTILKYLQENSGR
jgi:hypothetical protein